MPSRIDTAVHTKALDYLVAEHGGGGGTELFSRVRTLKPAAHCEDFERLPS